LQRKQAISVIIRNYQELSDGTDDQSGRLSPLRDGERKPISEKEFTSDKSAHKKEPPMRLELMTYALRKGSGGTGCSGKRRVLLRFRCANPLNTALHSLTQVS